MSSVCYGKEVRVELDYKPLQSTTKIINSSSTAFAKNAVTTTMIHTLVYRLYKEMILADTLS